MTCQNHSVAQPDFLEWGPVSRLESRTICTFGGLRDFFFFADSSWQGQWEGGRARPPRGYATATISNQYDMIGKTTQRHINPDGHCNDWKGALAFIHQWPLAKWSFDQLWHRGHCPPPFRRHCVKFCLCPFVVYMGASGHFVKSPLPRPSGINLCSQIWILPLSALCKEGTSVNGGHRQVGVVYHYATESPHSSRSMVLRKPAWK